MRREQTPAELALWQLLRGRQWAGLKFRRQAPVGVFIADFLCEKLRLVVELDGGVHDQPEQAERDRSRELYLQEVGYSVLRFRNEDVLEKPEQVLRQLQAWLRR